MRIVILDAHTGELIGECVIFNHDELITTLNVLLKPSMFGNRNFRIEMTGD